MSNPNTQITPTNPELVRAVTMSKRVLAPARKTVPFNHKRAIMKEIGAEASLLYEYYIMQAYNRHNNLLDDSVIARSVWFTKRKVQKCRLALQKHNWIFFKKKLYTTQLVLQFVFGKPAVVLKKAQLNIPLTELEITDAQLYATPSENRELLQLFHTYSNITNVINQI